MSDEDMPGRVELEDSDAEKIEKYQSKLSRLRGRAQQVQQALQDVYELIEEKYDVDEDKDYAYQDGALVEVEGEE